MIPQFSEFNLVGRIAQITCGKVCCKFIRSDVGIHATVNLYTLVGRLKFRTPTFPKAGAVFSQQLRVVQFVRVHFVIKSLTI